ncbi:MAG: hypothetical protein LKJ22_07150 [Liquorilactobacillus nagelii]|jgi:hypothetical protein|uniref:hypothetical protein n=1 Tax=Liquorilactobacillus nagelii TaxID=82688 RepID=UPI00242CF126|nr:hypothetical protein [Liquorilactobacillus nagelii]MCI1921688.1 hypothetical protein [Liquorilactobacillus nagelii]MCI1976280.1 hypothetical protein [Liquorilactobacillus nagelii]
MILNLPLEFYVFLNAATISTDLATAKRELTKIVAAYNFYPKIIMGLSEECFRMKIFQPKLPFSPTSNYLGSIPVQFWPLLELLDDRYRIIFAPNL